MGTRSQIAYCLGMALFVFLACAPDVRVLGQDPPMNATTRPVEEEPPASPLKPSTGDYLFVVLEGQKRFGIGEGLLGHGSKLGKKK